VLLAQERGRRRAAKELLLQYAYERGENISDVDTLVRAAAELGLDAAEVRRHLEGDAGRAAVMAEDARAKRQLGIKGVPHFIVGLAAAQHGSSGVGDEEQQQSVRRYALSGAQPAAALVRVVEDVLQEQAVVRGDSEAA
jgi:predicted DsbA family dithiol-disulfide isomerase